MSLMIPIDGQWTLAYDQIAVTINATKTCACAPHALRFSRTGDSSYIIKETVPVRTMSETDLKLHGPPCQVPPGDGVGLP